MRKLLVILCLLFASIAPSFAAEAVPIVHSTSYEHDHVLTTDPSKALYWLTVTWNTQALRWLIIYDATTVPGDGALSTSLVLYCAVASLATDPTQSSKSFDWTNHPLLHGLNGMVVVISTSASGCTAKTADGNNDWITAGVN
jgi:hypothetical protein